METVELSLSVYEWWIPIIPALRLKQKVRVQGQLVPHRQTYLKKQNKGEHMKKMKRPT